jgi:hypothetical protein
MLAFLFSRDRRSSLSDLQSGSATDCQKLQQAVEEEKREFLKEGYNTQQLSSKEYQSPKQRYVALINLRADSDEKKAQLWKSIRLQEQKSQQIQSLKIEGYQLFARSYRDAGKGIDSQPGETIKLPEPAQTEHKQMLEDALTKLAKAKEELKTYCNLNRDEPAQSNVTVSQP